MTIGQNTKEAICSIKIDGGEVSGSKDFTPVNGHVIGCSIYFPDPLPNQGIVRASIVDSSGKALSEMQDIRNYRNREAKYLEGIKPLNIMTDGTALTLLIQSKLPMDADFEADLILVYAPTQSQNCNLAAQNQNGY